jgi:hypothetical protein
MSINSKIKAGIISTLPLCLIDSEIPKNHGYNFDWDNCTINPINRDFNNVASDKFPIFDIYLGDETCENPEENTGWLSNSIDTKIAVVPFENGATEEDIDNIVDDIKKYLSRNIKLGTDEVFAVFYNGYRKFFTQSDDYFGAEISIKIKYFELRNK